MLVIFATHPIQYQVPLWQSMAKEGINFEVWYFTDFGINASYDVQFGKSFSWDLPMLEGYKYRFLKVNNNAAPNKGFKGIVSKENLKKLFVEQKVTHVYINGWQVLAYWQALWSAKSLGLTTIFKGESNDLKPEVSWKWPLKKILLSLFFKRIDYFLYIGNANKRLLLKHGIEEKKLLPGLYCIDNERFYKSSQEFYKNKYELRKKWGISSKSICILFSGKFIEKKRPIDIIKAVDLLKDEFKIHLLYVGSGELQNEIMAKSNVIYTKESGLISEYDSNKVNVSIIGFLNQNEIPKAYAISDFLILPSNFGETWGLVVNEAMACGIPAIVSDQCGSAEDLIKPIDENLIFQTGNIDGLVKAIKYSINHTPSTDIILKHISKYNYNSTTQSVKKVLNKI